MVLCALSWNVTLIVRPVVAIGIIVALGFAHWPTETACLRFLAEHSIMGLPRVHGAVATKLRQFGDEYATFAWYTFFVLACNHRPTAISKENPRRLSDVAKQEPWSNRMDEAVCV
jgi:hypothetical protein